MRHYSDRLLSSYRASAGYQSSVTVGTSRERQVVDFLAPLLPSRVSVAKDLVVVDNEGTRSPQFDGFILDRSNLPLLYAETPLGNAETIAVAMVESVIVCIETKSTLTKSELTDIFGKAQRLHSLKVSSASQGLPILASFAYECPNLGLAYFDYAVQFASNPVQASAPVAVLNQGLLGAARSPGGDLRLLPGTSQDAVPVLVETGRDSLLAFFYLLFRAVSREAPWNSIAESYSASFFTSLECFTFERDFLRAVSTDPEQATIARRAFQRHASRPVDESYTEARARIGL